MVRNLDHRVECAVPVFDKTISQRIINMLNIQLADNTKARLLDRDLQNTYVPRNNETAVRSQLDVYQYLQSVARPQQTTSTAAVS